MDIEEEDDASETYTSAPTFEAEPRSATSATAVAETTAVIEKAAPDTGHLSEEGLDRRYRPFLEALLAKPDWSLPDARELAKSHHVMLNGAIEAINEWSHEQFGDWLIEEGDSLVIHSTILRK